MKNQKRLKCKIIKSFINQCLVILKITHVENQKNLL